MAPCESRRPARPRHVARPRRRSRPRPRRRPRAPAASAVTRRPTRRRCTPDPAVMLGCADCHGGNAGGAAAAAARRATSAEYRHALDEAHVKPRFPEAWNYPSSVKPPRTYTLLNTESPEFIRFLNPSDYRVARETCGACHARSAGGRAQPDGDHRDVLGGGAYNNGILPLSAACSARPIRRTASRRRCSTPEHPPTPEMTQARHRRRSSIRCRRGRRCRRAMSSACSSAAAGPSAPQFPEIGNPELDRRAAAARRARPARSAPVEPRPGHRAARLDPDPQHHQDAAQRPDHVVSRHQRQPRRLPQFRLRRLPRRLRQRPRHHRKPGPMPQFGNRGTSHRHRPDDPPRARPVIRCSTG